MRFQEIQKKYEWVYRDFYVKYSTVMSGKFSFLWLPTGYGHRSHFLHPVSKIPLDCLVGFKKIKSNKTILTNITSYNISTQGFETCSFQEINKEYQIIEEEVTKFLQENGCTSSFEIGILSETTRGHSFGFSGTFAGTLALSLFYITGKVTQKDLDSYDTFLKSDIFKEVFLFAWKIELISRYGNTIGPTILGAMSDSNLIYLMSHEFSSFIDIENLTETPVIYQTMCERFSTNLISKELPLDYGMIFTGLPTNTKTIEEYQKAHPVRLNTISHFLENSILSDVPGSANVYFSKFAKKDSLYNHFCDNISILSIESIYLFKELLENGFEHELLNRFIELFNQYRHVASLIEQQSNFAHDFKGIFEKHATNPQERLGIMPVYSGKMGGGYMFVMKPNISRDTLDSALEEIRSSYPNAAIEYSSYLDGEGTGGIRLVQDSEKNLFSSFLQGNKYVYTNNFGESRTGEHGDFLVQEKEWLLLDFVNEKMYWNGKAVTSKDLKSQSTTIQLLDLLLKNVGEDVKSSLLPHSSYTKNKTEMIGKITAPLMHFIEEQSGEKLVVRCSGGLSDFSICMEKSSVRMGMIKKIL